ncbi:MAG: YlbF family regulator [Clostridia bacterium]|nr:YlbF family regulator [Clostridia bacterium]
MQVYDQANALARQIRESEVCENYRQMKEALEQDETSKALIKEYKKLQMQLQMAAVAGAQTEESEVQRFQQIGGLLMSNPATMQFLLAEMRLQQMMADVYKILNDAAGLDMPGL